MTKEFFTKSRIKVQDIPQEEWVISDPLFAEILSPPQKVAKKPSEGAENKDKRNRLSSKVREEVMLFAKCRVSSLIDLVLPVTSTYAKSGLGTTKAGAIKKYMVEEGLMMELPLSSRVGGDLVILEPSEELMESLKVHIKSGQGSVIHRAFQVLLAKRLKGGSVEFRVGSGEKAADVGTSQNGKTLAYEIAMSAPNQEYSNIIRDLSCFDEIKVFCQTKVLKMSLERMCEELPDEKRGRVSITLLSEIVFCLMGKQKWEEIF